MSRATIFLWRGTAYQRIALRITAPEPAGDFPLAAFDNDFADLFEVRGERRARRGATSRTAIPGGSQILMSYKGLDDEWRRTTLTFDPQPTEMLVNSATYRFVLAPQESSPDFFTHQLSRSC